MLRYVMAHKKKDDIRERGCRQAHDGLMTDLGLNLVQKALERNTFSNFAA